MTGADCSLEEGAQTEIDQPAQPAVKPGPNAHQGQVNAAVKSEASAAAADPSGGIGGAAREQIKAFVARIERLEEDKANVMADMKEVYAEAKSMGFDTKVLRKVIALRKVDARERQEAEALLELYLGAVES